MNYGYPASAPPSPSPSGELEQLGLQLEGLVAMSSTHAAVAFGTAERLLGAQPQDASAKGELRSGSSCTLGTLHELVARLEGTLGFLGSQLDRLSRL